MVSIWHKIASVSVLRVWDITDVCMVATPDPIQKGRVALLSPLVLGASPRRTRRQSLCWRGCSWCGYTSWPSSWQSWSWRWVLLGLVLGGEDGPEHGRADTGDWTAAATSGPSAAGEPNPAGAHDDLWGPDSGSSGPSCASSSSKKKDADLVTKVQPKSAIRQNLDRLGFSLSGRSGHKRIVYIKVPGQTSLLPLLSNAAQSNSV